MFRSNRAVKVLSVLYKLLGIFCVLWTLFFMSFVYFCLFVEPSEEVYIAGFGVVCVVVGFGGIVVSVMESRLLHRMKSLQIILSPVSDTPISVIAREWKVSLERAEKQLKKMIRRGHLKSVRLDMSGYQVVPLHKPVIKEPVMVEVECENCGGTNTIEKGKTGRCVYCDSAIKLK